LSAKSNPNRRSTAKARKRHHRGESACPTA
jgi:hypothetical protein